MIDALRRRWVLVAAITVLAAVGISLFETSYNALQTAASATAFRESLTSPSRAVGATACDIVFALGYGVLGLIALRALQVRPQFAIPAAVLIGASSLFDEFENALLIRNIVAEHSLTDGWITAMRVPGTLKWIGSPVFLLLLIALMVRAINRPRPRDSASG